MGKRKALKNQGSEFRKVMPEPGGVDSNNTDTESKIMDTENVVKFQNVCFAYAVESEKVFDHVSFEVHAGDCVGVAGESGAGKTTLLNLLCGFYSPDAGNIFFWEREIHKWDLQVLRKHIAYVSQENQVIIGTVKENIGCSHPGADMEQMKEAARLAGLDEFISQLPNQYDTELGEHMDEWSGGQYQRLNLARAFLQEADLYLFDEPSSSLDGQNEEIIMSSIERLRDLKKTVFIVSHRPDLLKGCNYIFFLHKGKIAGQGTHLQAVPIFIL